MCGQRFLAIHPLVPIQSPGYKNLPSSRTAGWSLFCTNEENETTAAAAPRTGGTVGMSVVTVGLTRRVFLVGSAGAGLVLGGMRGAAAAPAAPAAAWVLYDPRFPASRDIAARLHGPKFLRPARGDVSALLPDLWRLADGADGFAIAGVTPGSVPFCVAQAVRGREKQTQIMERLDRDLFVWAVDWPRRERAGLL
jgi:hypothetical protein